MTSTRLSGKVAIVTGAGARQDSLLGTGRAISLCMAREGAKVLVADIEQANAARTVDEIRAADGVAISFQADSTSMRDNEKMIDAAVKQFGRLDILVNNVGVSVHGNVDEIDEAGLKRSIDLNLNSAVYASKFAIAAMRGTRGGSIINVSSIDGLSAGMFHNTPYALAKGALHMLTKTTAAYHGREGIRANCIAPGPLHASFTYMFSDYCREFVFRCV
jgi:NAD(P)-dependent dehydrogenase (short-subunit alcohol dehydrogenase family)